jgi:hypothetical protein
MRPKKNRSWTSQKMMTKKLLIKTHTTLSSTEFDDLESAQNKAKAKKIGLK